jgi:chromosome partitioning protein
MSNIVFVGGQKGGTTKTCTGHLLCLGAILCKQPADYVLTDPKRELKAEGRPYGVIDGRIPAKLAQVIGASHSSENGWLIIDGGGNRQAFDTAMADEANLVLLPFRDSEEDLEAVSLDLKAMPHALAWPSAWPTNAKAQATAQPLIEALSRAFPLRVISPPLYFVNSAKELLGASLDNPSTPVRSAARRAFGIMAEHFEAQQVPQKQALTA